MGTQPRVLVSRASCHTECNCACSDDEDLSDPLLCFDQEVYWCANDACIREALDDNHIVCISPSGNGTIAVLNHASLRILEAFRTPQTIAHLEIDSSTDCRLAAFAEMARAGLLTAWPQSARTSSFASNSTLTVWLHLTNACNLRCSYCFVHHNTRRMSEAMGRQAVDAAFRAASEGDYTTVKLKYAGGEPTLAFDCLRTVHQHAHVTAARQNIGLRELLLSNGVRLTDSMIHYLHDECIQVMISLDGIGQFHDCQRSTLHGSKTFASVADAIDRCLQFGIAPDLSITVTAQNASGLAQVVAFALDRSLRFNLNFVRSDSNGAPTALRADDTALVDGVCAALRVIESRLPPYRLIDGLLDRSSFHGAREYACGAGRNYFAIDVDGRVARCHAEMAVAVADVNDSYPLAAVRETRVPGALEPLPSSQRHDCADCRWRPWCGGGCPLQTYRTTGAWDQPSPYCSVYQTIFPEILRIEGLRLLKYASMAAA